MFYGVASPDWKPGRPLSLAGALLFRTRSEALAFVPDARAVAVPVRFDAARGEIRAQRPSGTVERWKAAAAANSLGGLTVFGTIPGEIVRPLGEFDGPTRPEAERSHPQPADFGGWDSLTMALLA